ncbi:phage tail protein [Pandoraea sputorum]|uniref:phage tail protein n=1 Tax=Pandoraea sputorum TaxID=93222 RepID=UPI002F3FAE72
MPDLNHIWGSDLTVSASGDLLMVDGSDQTQQRILRRLMTNPRGPAVGGVPPEPGDYIFHLDYGAGLPREVGRTVDIGRIRAKIRGQILREATVARQPAPVITVQAIPQGVSVSIRYTDNQTGQQATLSFNVNQ